MLCKKTFSMWWSFIINRSNMFIPTRGDIIKMILRNWWHASATCPPQVYTGGAAGAKKAAWTGANWKRIDFPPKLQLDLSSAHVYSTNPSFPPLALIGLQSFLLPLLALTAFLNEPQKFSSISCKGKFSLGNDQVWPEISSADAIFRSAFSEIFSCIYKSKWFAFLLLYFLIKWTFYWKNAFSGYLAFWRHTYKEDECQESVELPEKTNKLIWCNVRKLELVSTEKDILPLLPSVLRLMSTQGVFDLDFNWQTITNPGSWNWWTSAK